MAGNSQVSPRQAESGRLGLTTVYEPESQCTTVDIILIHGLGGNSTKTWSNSGDPESFWPESWLPKDPEFVDARIHVFGYFAKWKVRQESPLSIHFIAQTLLSELKNNPGIRKDVTRLILIGHSMGGCVAKKAYILARQDPTCQALAGRIHSIFFLGTPHRGSNLASVLDNMASMAFGKKQFVRDLIPNSSALTEMNDAFRHYALDLRLWSFYETKPVVMGPTSRIIVEKSSSTLDYPNEEIAAMNADHRHVCRFESPDDPNYRLLRNALNTALDMIRESPERKQGVLMERQESLSRIQAQTSPVDETSRLMSFFKINDDLDDDLSTLHMMKESGSCEWLCKKPFYAEWEQGSNPQVLWIIGRPGTGKSVLSSHVVDRLLAADMFCSSFFFKNENSGKTSLSDCFLSLAYQMARHDDAIRDSLSQLMEEEPAWDKSDALTVWRRLFIGAIFKSPSISKHIWVMDGIDECSNFGVLFTKKLLQSTPIQLRLLATSRDLDEVGRGLHSMGPRVLSHTITEDDTFDDMKLFLSAKLTELDRLESSNGREAMQNRILQKSRGSFLWVRLVLQEFENAWTEEAMEAVLQKIPAGLHEVYHRILVSIQDDPHKKDLAKSILTWVILAARPLSVDEIRCAIKLDIDQTVPNMAKAIANICGQLVFVDQSQKVQILHETFREFLVQDDHELQLSILKDQSNTRMSFLLLRYLCNGVLKPRNPTMSLLFRPKGLGGARGTGFIEPDQALLEYAARFFPHHISASIHGDDSLLQELCAFFKTSSCLYWIEHHAQQRSLGNITNAAMDLRQYLEQRTKFNRPTDSQISFLESWVVDLVRVAAKFRSQLLSCPSSIHGLIPPLCPPESAISLLFSRNAKLAPLIVKNLPDGGWDDCLGRIDHTKGSLSVVTYGKGLFGIGFSTGRIVIYDSSSLQTVREMEHGQWVLLLKFSAEDDILVSCSKKSLVAWDAKTGMRVGEFALTSLPLNVEFLWTNELLMFSESTGLMKLYLLFKDS